MEYYSHLAMATQAGNAAERLAALEMIKRLRQTSARWMTARQSPPFSASCKVVPCYKTNLD
jgi:hypothetical protein